MTKRILILALLVAAAVPLRAAQARPATAASPTPAVPKPASRVPLSFEGIVVGPDGAPVADAVIVIASVTEFRLPPAIVRTPADGKFRIAAPGRGPHTVRIEARGLAPQTIEKARPGAPLRVTLDRGGSIEGAVRDAATGQPVAGARVEAREDVPMRLPAWEPGLGMVTALTDARGVFRIDGLSRRRHTLTASSRRAGRATRSGVAVGQRVEMLLVAGASIGGRVLTPQGKPVAGAGVRVESEFGPPYVRSTVSDASGRFEAAGLSSGAYRLIATHKDWALAVSRGLRVDRTGEIDVDVTLAPPVKVTGRLVDGDDRPVAGTLSVQEIDGLALPRLAALLSAEVAADGRFVLERVPPGSHAADAGGPGMASRRISLEVGVTQATLDLGDVVLDPGAQIRGRVRDQAGAPVAEASLSAFPDRPSVGGAALPLEARTGADGSFALGGATLPGYRLSVRAPGFAQLSRVVEAPSEGVEIVLTAAGVVTGTVVDDAGRPVESFEVETMASGGGEGRQQYMPDRQNVTSEAGRFTVEGLAAGTYSLRVTARDVGRQVVSDVAVTAGGTTDVGRVRLAAGGAIRGTVVDAASAPVAGATVTAYGSERRFVMSDDDEAITDARGAFHLRALPPGRVVVFARHPDFAEGRSAPVEVDPSRTAETTIAMTRGSRVEGVVRRRGGLPPEGWISVQSMDGFDEGPGTIPAPDGSFVVDRVAPGRARVSLATKGAAGGRGRWIHKDIVVREGETTHVELVWREILLSGKVTRGGAPLANVRLTARGNSGTFFGGRGTLGPPVGPQHMTAVTREDGSYEMIVGEPGRVMITAESTVERKVHGMRPVEVRDAEAHTADIEFPASGVGGVVVDEASGAPIARATVGALPLKEGGTVAAFATTDTEGRFSIDVDPGEFRLRASAEGYAPSDPTEVTVGEAAAGDIRIALSRGSALRGRIVDSRGRPAPGISINAAGPSPMGRATSSLDGAFEFDSLREGRYTLTAGSALAGFAMLTDVAPGAADVTLRLAPGGRILARVVAADGTPLARAWVAVRAVDGMRLWLPEASARTIEDGTAELPSPAGTVTIEVNVDGRTGTGQGTVVAGGVTPITARLNEEEAPPAP